MVGKDGIGLHPAQEGERSALLPHIHADIRQIEGMEEVELGRGDGQSGVGHGPAGDIQQRSRVAVLFQMPHGAFAPVGGAVHVE